MGILSSSVSITRYQVKGNLNAPILEAVANGLKKNAISEIDGDVSEKTVGWTSFHNPFHPDFSDSSFVYGNYFVFSLRIDKKSMSPQLIKKHFAMESARHLASSGRQFLSRNEKKVLKDKVIQKLSVRIPATPSIYDTIWNYEESCLWFFSNLKAANEALENIFSHSFQLTLLRLFPYTDAYLTMALSGLEKDQLTSLSPSGFTE
ncbi:MAG: recombination-associated protein RdgC [Desulfobacteraceae bacterium]